MPLVRPAPRSHGTAALAVDVVDPNRLLLRAAEARERRRVVAAPGTCASWRRGDAKAEQVRWISCLSFEAILSMVDSIGCFKTKRGSHCEEDERSSAPTEERC